MFSNMFNHSFKHFSMNHEVRQVSMPNCEFMAAFAAMSMYPESLKEIFHTVKDGQKDPNHLYTFKVTYKGREGYLAPSKHSFSSISYYFFTR